MLRVGTLLLITFTAVSFSTARAAEVDPLLPKEAEQVIFINVKQAVETDVVKNLLLPQLLAVLKAADAQEVLEKLGLDPLKDITSLTVGTWTTTGQPQNMLVIGRGRFNAAKMYKAVGDLGEKYAGKVAVVTEENLKMIRVGEKDKAESNMFVMIVDDATVIAGREPKYVAAAAASHKTKAKPSLTKEMTALVLKQDAKATLYTCQLTNAKTPLKVPPLNLPGVDAAKLKEQLAGMENFSVTVRASKAVEVELTAGMKDAKLAEAFGGSVNKLIEAAQTFLPVIVAQQPKAKPVVDDVSKSLKFKVSKSEVIVSLKVSADAISKATAVDK